MKIVVTGTRGFPNIMGGVETHCEELYPRLAKIGYDVVIARRSSYVNREADKRAGVSSHVWKGVRLWDLKSPRKKSFETIIHTTKAVIMAQWIGADAVHIHTVGAALCTPIARLFGLKVVFTHHGPDYDRDKWGAGAKMILKLGEWCGCKFANEVIVISEVIKELIAKKHGRTEHVHLIYNGVSDPQICHDSSYFGELGIEEGKYILGMCRFVPEKRLHDLISAYVMAREKGLIPVNVKLVLAGDNLFEDEYTHNLKKTARENGVVLTGFVKGTKLHSLLSNALCYSLPSAHEGLPISLLEAMSYRLPVVVSDIAGNLEVHLDKDCYFHLGDIEELANKLAAICQKPLQHVDYDMSKYDWDVIAKQVAEVYESI